MQYYDYDSLLQDIRTFPTVYAAGHSAFGRPIWCIPCGHGGGGMLVHAAIHAREYITAPVVVAMARSYLAAYRKGGLPPCDFLPMVNPDGVDLCLHGAISAPPIYRRRLVQINGGQDFGLWKANGQGVDVNVNFDADWGKGQGNLSYPAPQGYVGPRPVSSPEAACLVRLTMRKQYAVTLSYHCKGEVIYYGYGCGSAALHSQGAAEYLAQYLGYEACRSVGSTGGYKDWYALRYPTGVALTVEIGSDAYQHPFPYTQVGNLVQQHSEVARYMAAYRG